MPKLPEWKLERYVLGELPEEDLQQIARLQESDAEVAESIALIERSNQEILAHYPAKEMAEKIQTRTAQTRPAAQADQHSKRRKNSRKGSVIAFPQRIIPAVAAAALALFVVFFGLYGTGFFGSGANGAENSGSPRIQGLEGQPGIRLKGMEPGIQMYRKRGGEVELLESGEPAAAGDILQIGYIAPGAEYGVLFSVDGNGIVTLHSPETETASAKIPETGRMLLDSAYRLDDAPRFERFFLLTAEEVLDPAEVLKQVRSVIHTRGQLPTSRTELHSSIIPSGISEEEVQWYLFTLKK